MPWGCENFLLTHLLHQQPPASVTFKFWLYNLIFHLKSKSRTFWAIYRGWERFFYILRRKLKCNEWWKCLKRCMSAYPESLSFVWHEVFHALPLWIVKPFFGFETEITLVALRWDGPGNLCHLATPPPHPPTHVLFTAFKLPPNCSSLFHVMTILALGGVGSKFYCKKKETKFYWI